MLLKKVTTIVFVVLIERNYVAYLFNRNIIKLTKKARNRRGGLFEKSSYIYTFYVFYLSINYTC